MGLGADQQRIGCLYGNGCCENVRVHDIGDCRVKRVRENLGVKVRPYGETCAGRDYRQIEVCRESMTRARILGPVVA